MERNSVKHLLQRGESSVVPIVRVLANQYHMVTAQLDRGARGVMVPMVESGESERDLVAFAGNIDDKVKNRRTRRP
jgi:2-keto-3-deoxy-L-rhamnonate aldolase RhmA